MRYAAEPTHVIRTPVANPDAHNASGAVIEFRNGAHPDEVARAQAFLDRLVERGIIEPTVVQTYNNQVTHPVWYTV